MANAYEELHPLLFSITVRSIINPDKLGHLGPLADVRGVVRERRGAGTRIT